MRKILAAILAIGLIPTDGNAQTVTKIKPGQFADVTVQVPDDGFVVWLIYPPPAQRAVNLPNGRLIFGGVPGSSYTAVGAVIAPNKKDSKELTYTFVFEGGNPNPNPVPNPIDPIKPPPVDPIKPPEKLAFYYLVVRPDGPMDQNLTKVLSDPTWNTLRARGHTIKDVTVTRAKDLGLAPTEVPVIYTLVVSADGRTSTIHRGPQSIPSTSADILKLAEGGK